MNSSLLWLTYRFLSQKLFTLNRVKLGMITVRDKFRNAYEIHLSSYATFVFVGNPKGGQPTSDFVCLCVTENH